MKVSRNANTSLNTRRFVTIAALLAATWLAGCGGGSGSQTPTVGTSGTGSTGTSQYAKAYQNAAWASTATVSFPSTCSMTFTTTGAPPYHSDYYLAPVSTQYPTEVAQTPVSKTPMSVVPYMASLITSQTVTVNTCPQRASATTATNMGAIGYMISGEALFNPYEGGPSKVPAMSDNVSYTFTPSSGGSEQTASFIDSCNSHPTPLTAGYTWHHHGIPTCLVAQVDGATGPSHLIGFALDGFPIYGGRDVNGKVISVSQLDACNGITSATPEFPKGAYHYVLPVGVTGTHSSLNCYSGTPASP